MQCATLGVTRRASLLSSVTLGLAESRLVFDKYPESETETRESENTSESEARPNAGGDTRSREGSHRRFPPRVLLRRGGGSGEPIILRRIKVNRAWPGI